MHWQRTRSRSPAPALPSWCRSASGRRRPCASRPSAAPEPGERRGGGGGAPGRGAPGGGAGAGEGARGGGFVARGRGTAFRAGGAIGRGTMPAAIVGAFVAAGDPANSALVALALQFLAIAAVFQIVD